MLWSGYFGPLERKARYKIISCANESKRCLFVKFVRCLTKQKTNRLEKLKNCLFQQGKMNRKKSGDLKRSLSSCFIKRFIAMGEQTCDERFTKQVVHTVH